MPSSARAAANIDQYVWGGYNTGAFTGQDASDAIDVGYAGWSDPATTTEDGSSCVVAVLDTGVDETNPDLAGKLWNFSDEPQAVQDALRAIPGVDAHGFFVDGENGSGTSTSGIPVDGSHGTHVAGTIAAEWDGQGMSGISENAKIMSVRRGSDSAADAVACLDYVRAAAEAGVNVRLANCSWVFGQSHGQLSIALAVTRLGEAHVTSVFGAGNSAFDNDVSNFTTTALKNNPYVVAVDAIDPSGAFAAYSNYGAATTNVTAPGSTILSTVLQTTADGGQSQPKL